MRPFQYSIEVSCLFALASADDAERREFGGAECPRGTMFRNGCRIALILALGMNACQPDSMSVAARRASSLRDSASFVGSRAGDERDVGGVRLCWCPPGKFTMGSPPGEADRRPDEAQVEVTLTRGFWMGKYEVTQGEWLRVAGAFPARQPTGEGGDFPVVEVSYLEAEEFCEKLTEQARNARTIPTDWAFRLPTEAQWEYACRAGTTTATAYGETLSSRQANFRGDVTYNGDEEGPSRNRAAAVGSYPANPWGLHDMHGNIFEWCRDWYHQTLPGGEDPDLSVAPGTPNRDGTYSRVRRGGAWNDEGKYCRSAFRLRYEPERRSDHIGFRVVAVRQ